MFGEISNCFLKLVAFFIRVSPSQGSSPFRVFCRDRKPLEKKRSDPKAASLGALEGTHPLRLCLASAVLGGEECRLRTSTRKTCRRQLFFSRLTLSGFESLPCPLPGQKAFRKKREATRRLLLLARWKGLEPPTFWFVAKHSIQLSYQRICLCQSILPQTGWIVKGSV